MRILLSIVVGALISFALTFGALYYFLPKELYIAVIVIIGSRTQGVLNWLGDIQRLAALAGIGAFILAVLAARRSD